MAHKTRDVLDTLAALEAETGKTARELAPIVDELYTLAKRADHYNEMRCNVEMTDQQEARADRIDARMVALVASIGLTGTPNGDPRGFAFYVHLPKTGRYNSWGGAETGWGIG